VFQELLEEMMIWQFLAILTGKGISRLASSISHEEDQQVESFDCEGEEKK
jgi:hypothetical protein